MSVGESELAWTIPAVLCGQVGCRFFGYLVYFTLGPTAYREFEASGVRPFIHPLDSGETQLLYCLSCSRFKGADHFVAKEGGDLGEFADGKVASHKQQTGTARLCAVLRDAWLAKM